MRDIMAEDRLLLEQGKMRLIGLEFKMVDRRQVNHSRELKMIDLDDLIVPVHAVVAQQFRPDIYHGDLIFPITIHTNLGDINGNL